MKTLYDLIVIGGGPAGSSAAITAARRGVRTLLLERGRLPRQKVCGEFVSAESLDILADLLAPGHRDALTRAPHITSTRIFLDDRILQAPVHPAAASIARLDLDLALWRSAEAAGAETLQSIVVQQVCRDGHFIVRTSAGEFESVAVVNASGRWSKLKPAPTLNGQPRWIGLKGHFEEKGPPDSVDLYFFEGGYCGVQRVDLRAAPSPDRINVCAMVRSDVASTLAEVFTRNAALAARSARWKKDAESVSTSPLLFHQPRTECDGMLMAGDAACFVDPFIGDGISLALRSGKLAAHCVLRAIQGGASLLEETREYTRDYKGQFGMVYRNSSGIRRMLGLPSVIRKPAVAALAKVPAITGYLVRKTR